MRANRWLWWIALVGCGLVASASAEQAVRWQVSLDTAKRLASQTNRLVLIHFWADWCEPCRQMEQEVFAQQEVASGIESAFVPVRINVDHFPRTREQFGITVLPTEVIMTPEGQLVQKISGVADAEEYLARLNQAVALVNRPRASQPASPGGTFPNMWGTAPPQYGPPVTQPPQYEASGQAVHPDRGYAGQVDRREEAERSLVGPRYAGSAGPALGSPPGGVPSMTGLPTNDVARGGPASIEPRMAASPPTAQGRPTPPGPASQDLRSQIPGLGAPPSMSQGFAATIQLPPGNPPLGLDGYCPVELSESKRWVRGDTRWGLLHRGRTYLFAGPEQRDRFDADPDRYAPMASGHDVVLLTEQGQLIPGRREHGGWFEDRVYLFSGEETYLRFHAAPERYVRTLLEMSEQPNVARRPSGSLDFQRAPAGPAPRDLSRGWR